MPLIENISMFRLKYSELHTKKGKDKTLFLELNFWNPVVFPYQF